MKFKVIVLLSFLLVCFGCKTYAFLSAVAKATIVVVDEGGKPIEGAQAGIAFEKSKSVEPGISINSVDGLTDSQGRFVAQHSNDSNLITYGATKEGYYPSSGEFRFSDRDPLGWKPWNPELKIVLREVENPVPMYARKTDRLKIPIVGQEVGFDLIAFDWVNPYGRGLHSDLIFLLEKHLTSMKEFSTVLTVRFNANDGILLYKENFEFGSEMKLPRFAPEQGYASEIVIKVSRKSGEPLRKSYENDDNYIFRVRSEKTKDGKIRSMYGKFHGPIKIEPRTEPTTLMFKYYLNPDYTRNLEFDPKRNLFGSLPPLEQVGIQ